MPISRFDMMNEADGMYHPVGFTRFEPYYIFTNEDHSEMILESHYVGARVGEKFKLTVDKEKQILKIVANRIYDITYSTEPAGAFFGGAYGDGLPNVMNHDHRTKRVMTDRLLVVPEITNNNRHKYHDVLSMQESFHITGPFIKMFRSKLKQFVEYNGLTYPDYGSLDAEIRALTSPISRLLNTVYYPDYSSKEGISSNELELMDSFEDMVTYIFGKSTPKLIKLTAARLFKYQEGEIGIAPESDQIFNAQERADAIRLGYSGKTTYVPLRINTVQLDLGWVALAQILVEAFGIDKAYNILENLDVSFHEKPFDEYNGVYVNFLKTMGYDYTKKILHGMSYFDSTFYDTIWMWEKYREGKLSDKLKAKGFEPLTIPKKCKDINEIHNKISKPYTEIKAVDDLRHINYAKLKYHRVLKSLHRSKFGEYEIIFADSSKDLAMWGKCMSHCIASYSDRVIRDDTMVFALMKDGKMTYNAEVKAAVVQAGIHRRGFGDSMTELPIDKDSKRFEVIQCRTVRNESMEKKDIIKLENFINEQISRKRRPV